MKALLSILFTFVTAVSFSQQYLPMLKGDAVYQAATPTFSPVGGTYGSSQSVTISTATSGATIYYTTNGSTPTTSSSVYSGAISVSSTETIKAIAVKSGYTSSEVATATYTISGEYVRQNILWSADAEGSGWADPFYNIDAASCCSYSVTHSTTFNYAGSGSIRFELNRTDPYVGLGSRAELTPLYTESQPYVERWVGFAAYIPDTSWAEDISYELIHQVHGQNGESPPFGIRLWYGRYFITVNYDSAGALKYHDYDTGIDYLTNQWNTYVTHVKYAHDGTGFIYVWVNGTLIFQYVNRITQYSYAENSHSVTGGNFYRFGVYKAPWSDGWSSNVSRRVFYEDEMRIGDENATYEDVAPGGVGAFIPVPIKFDDLVFLHQTNELQWSAFEYGGDNYDYEVQESDDGITWQTVGILPRKYRGVDGERFTYNYNV